MARAKDLEVWANCDKLDGRKPTTPQIYAYIEDTKVMKEARQLHEKDLATSIQRKGLRVLPKIKLIEDLGLFHNPYKGNINKARWALVECPYCKAQYEVRMQAVKTLQSCQHCKHVVKRLKKLISIEIIRSNTRGSK